MGIEVTFREPLWDCLPGTIAWLGTQRDPLTGEDQIDLRAGLNFAIILSTACYLEGTLEAVLVGLLRQRRNEFAQVVGAGGLSKPILNSFFSRVGDEIEVRIARTTGVQNYDEVFELLVGQRLSLLPEIAPNWEGLRVLFHLRNLIAHGRPTAARFLWKGGSSWEEDFRGGYQIAQDYLVKKSLIESRFVVISEEEFRPVPRIIFVDAVANHFWDVARSCVDGLVPALEGNDREVVTAILQLGPAPRDQSAPNV